MFVAGTPTAIRLSTMAATTSGAERIFGAPEQFSFTPTTSLALKNPPLASRSVFAPVSERMPRDIISRTVGTSTFDVELSMHFSECTRITLPGYGPGIPGDAERGNELTTRYVGPRSGTAADAV